jgi:DNA polymerase II small subunit
METESIVKELTQEGCLVEPSIVDTLQVDDIERIRDLSPKPQIINQRFLENMREQADAAATEESERSDLVDDGDRNVQRRTKVEVEKHFENGQDGKDIPEFVQYFNDRYERMRELLENRMELSNAVSIGRLDDYGEKEEVSVIGMVSDKYKTSSGRWIVYLEDPSGDTKVLIDEEEGERIIEDEVIGIAGVTGDDIVFSNDIVRPDVPISREVRKTDEEVYAAFISDMHFGSIDYMEDSMEKFLEWLRSDDPQAERVSYIFVNGDMVEGVGNYPGQHEELVVEDIYKQYERFEEFLRDIPDDIEVIVVPGNHDIVRLAEPQPKIPEEACPETHDKENVHWLSNPATVRIHGFDGPGIRVLLYHGYSFDRHVDAIPDLREKGYEEPHHVMVDYLKRRHLAPTFGSNLLSPEERDYMVIDEVPDIFTMGHTHAFDVTNYKGINLISSGTMQSQTDFQERMGHKPDPGMIAVVNLKTRDTTVKEL